MYNTSRTNLGPARRAVCRTEAQERTHGAGVNIWNTDPARLPCGEGSTSYAWIGPRPRAGDRRFSFTGSTQGCPRANADYELSRCAASADHEFRRGLDSSGTLPAIHRYLSGIERADLLGLPVARRGFWDATFPNSPGRKEETTPSARGNTSRPEPVELFGAVSVILPMKADEWTPLLEPSRCGSSDASCRKKMNRLHRLRHVKSNANVAVEGTSLNF